MCGQRKTGMTALAHPIADVVTKAWQVASQNEPINLSAAPRNPRAQYSMRRLKLAGHVHTKTTLQVNVIQFVIVPYFLVEFLLYVRHASYMIHYSSSVKQSAIYYHSTAVCHLLSRSRCKAECISFESIYSSHGSKWLLVMQDSHRACLSAIIQVFDIHVYQRMLSFGSQILVALVRVHLHLLIMYSKQNGSNQSPLVCQVVVLLWQLTYLWYS